MNKNYDYCPFKLTIPTLTETPSAYHITFSLLTKSAAMPPITLVLNGLTLQDQFGHTLKLEPDLQVYVLGDTVFRKPVTAILHKNGLNCLLSNSRLIVTLLDGVHHQKIAICFIMNRLQKYTLENVELLDFSPQDTTYFKKVSRLSKKYSQTVPHTPKLPTETAQTSTPSQTFSSHPFVEKYRKALLREIALLRHNGGRKYKVTNGKLISQKADEFAYIFELETELYLADASPISVKCPSGDSSGEILLCEDFTLTVLLKHYIGEHLPIAYITVEPWKLLQALCAKLEEFGTGNRFPIARMLVEDGPSLCNTESSEAIPKGQAAALRFAQQNPITVIWGPPGTGKTYTMSTLALKFALQGKKVLIVSHSNVSVDGVIGKIVQRLAEKGQSAHWLPKGYVLRYGYVRDEILSKNDYATSFNFCIKQFPQLIKQRDALEAEKKELKLALPVQSAKLIEVEKKLQHLRMQIKEHEKNAVQKARIVATTISKVSIDKIFEDVQYDVVMFDEASMAYVPQIFTAACLAKKHFICVGDFFQLPPITQSSDQQGLGEDIFQFLGIVNRLGRINYHPWLVMLHLQRRMHPHIAYFASREIYSGLLKSEKTAADQIQRMTDSAPFEGHPLIHLDLTGTYCAASKNSDHSRFNVLSALIAFQTALDCEIQGGHQVGIITSYAAQTRLIRAMIDDYRTYKPTQIVCSTVHQFQGSERDVILFDTIESYPLLGSGWLLSKNENNHVTRLINVAVTRAKGKLITISHNRFWQNTLGSTHHALYRLLKYQEQAGLTLSQDTLNTYLQSHHYKGIDFYTDEDYLKPLLADLDHAKESIKVSLPSGQLLTEDDQLEQALFAALKRGLKLGIKCNTYKDLPPTLKKISVGTENAIFPLIVIDGTIIWYGVPPARTSFTTKTNRYFTTCQLIVRFSGPQTADMITSLTGLDEVVVGHQHRPLFGKMSSERLYTSQSSKLAHFITETYKCPLCKEPLTLKKGKRGKSYLGCTKCPHTQYLKPELVNHYMTLRDIVCPEHHTPLEAKVGQYGVYLQCCHDDERHYLKPEQI